MPSQGRPPGLRPGHRPGAIPAGACLPSVECPGLWTTRTARDKALPQEAPADGRPREPFPARVRIDLDQRSRVLRRAGLHLDHLPCDDPVVLAILRRPDPPAEVLLDGEAEG